MFQSFVRNICKNNPYLCEAIIKGYALCEALSSEPLTYQEAVKIAHEMAYHSGMPRLTIRRVPDTNCTIIDHVIGGVPRWCISPSENGIVLSYGRDHDNAREITTVGDWRQSLSDYINFGPRSSNTYFYRNPIPSENMNGINSIEELF